jgi:predicted DNA-binding transcriptional regulator AlpA
VGRLDPSWTLETIMRAVPVIEPEDELLTTPMIARELGISRSTVYLLVISGRLPDGKLQADS